MAIVAGEGKDFSAGIDLMGMAPLIPTLKNWDFSVSDREAFKTSSRSRTP